MSNENAIAPDASESWYREREARIQADRERVGAQKITLENAYSNVEAQWRQLDEQAEEAHDSLNTRAILDIERQRARLSSDAAQLQEGYATLQQQEAQLERAANLDYASLRDNSSEKSKLFLEVWKSKVENDPSALRRLLHADSVARAHHTPDTNDYFAAIEQHMGFKPEERRFEFENEAKDKPSRGKEGQARAIPAKSRAASFREEPERHHGSGICCRMQSTLLEGRHFC